MGPQGFAYVITKFVRKNFHLQKFKMQMLLKDKELWNIVSRMEVKSTSNFTKWEKTYRKARTFIIMGLHDSLLQNVIGAKTSKETWDCLLKVYETKGLTNKLFLKRQFFAYKVNPMDSMLDHINKKKSMSQQLEAIREKLGKSDVVMVLFYNLPKF